MRKSMARVARSLILGVTLAAIACAGRHHSQSEPTPDIPLKVTNHNWLDVTIYVLHDGQRTRVGSVTGSSTQEFTLPGRLLGQSHQLALLGEAIGSSNYARTEVLNIQAGQALKGTVGKEFRGPTRGRY